MRGNAPVPIVAWLCAVCVGDDPTVASSNHTPPDSIERSVGHASGHRARTSMPAASHTRVTSSRGVRAGRGPSISA